MKIKELMNLMVGDILMAYHDDGESQRNFPVIVDGIDENGTLVDGECYISWKPLQKEDSEEDYADEMNPIPLTAEILKKNGWRQKNDEMGDRYCEFKNYDCTIYYFFEYHTINLRSGRQSVFIEDKRYVHELQHALRLCGLTELADNFKVE